jgi:hypothetical protein
MACLDACAGHNIAKSSANFSANTSAFRCLVGIVISNGHFNCGCFVGAVVEITIVGSFQIATIQFPGFQHNWCVGTVAPSSISTLVKNL